VQQFYDYATLITLYSIYALSLNVLLGYAGPTGGACSPACW
jgi:ABC-type branched-subunit amino acid transport system permease subunit